MTHLLSPERNAPYARSHAKHLVHGGHGRPPARPDRPAPVPPQPSAGGVGRPGGARRAYRQEALQLLSNQIFLAADGFDLGQDGFRGLIVARDRDRFSAPDMLPVGYGYDNHSRLSATAAGNAKCLLERPDFFLRLN